MIDISDNGRYADISIIQIYRIMDSYYSCCCSLDEDHSKLYSCGCNEFYLKQDVKTNNNTEKIKNSIQLHYNHTHKINDMYSAYKQKLSNNGVGLTYNVSHTISMQIDDLKFTSKCDIIGYTSTDVFVIMLKPQFNKLNYNDIITEAVMNTFMLLNQKQSTDLSTHKDSNKKTNYERYNGKKIHICIISLDTNNPIFLNFDVDKNDKYIQNDIIHCLTKKYSGYSEKIYKFVRFHLKDDLNKN